MLYFCSKRFLFGCVLATLACIGFTEEVSGQVKHYFQGAKTGERFNRGLVYGDAGIGSPFTRSGNSYSVDSSRLSHDTASFALLTTFRTLLNGGNVRVEFSNTSTIAGGTTTYVRLDGPPYAPGDLGRILNIGGLVVTLIFLAKACSDLALLPRVQRYLWIPMESIIWRFDRHPIITRFKLN